METANMTNSYHSRLLNIFPSSECALKNCPDVHNRVF